MKAIARRIEMETTLWANVYAYALEKHLPLVMHLLQIPVIELRRIPVMPAAGSTARGAAVPLRSSHAAVAIRPMCVDKAHAPYPSPPATSHSQWHVPR